MTAHSGAPSVWRRLGYQPRLDGLRGLAVIAVIGYHFRCFGGGSSGVTLFFTLSGFLITCLLVEEFDASGGISLRHFYIRRGLRLLPALLLVLAVDVVFALTGHSGWARKADIAVAASVLLYVADWVQAYMLLPLNQLAHTWSLAVEEQFYLLWPVVLLFLISRTRIGRRQLAALIAVAAACFTTERLVLPHFGATAIRLYNGSDTRSDALLIGAAAALVFHHRWIERRPRVRLVVEWLGPVAFTALALHLFVGIGAVPRSVSLQSLGHHTVVALLTATVILALTCCAWKGVVPSILNARPLLWVGRLSYGLYLWHYLLLSMIDETHMITPDWLRALVICGATLAVASASYYIVEKPCLAYKAAFAGQHIKPIDVTHRASATAA